MPVRPELVEGLFFLLVQRMVFWTYMLHCRGGAFYVGHTDDLERRIAQHKSGTSGGFTCDKLPVELVWSQEFPARHEALAAERQIKGWSRAKKLALIRADWAAVSRLAKGKSGPSTSSGRTGTGLECSGEVALTAKVIASLLAHAAAAHPQECCGLLLGHAMQITGAEATANIHPTPHTHFEIDPAALIAAHRAARDGGAQIVGYYHSHPHGPAEPSATDSAQASGDGRVWAIIGQGEVRLWQDTQSGFSALCYSAGCG